MTGWHAAIEECDLLPEDRRAFLLERMQYWFDWARDASRQPCITRGERE
jgi:hypothetical protein